VHHIAPVIGAVPVRGPGRTPDDVAACHPYGRAALITDPSRAGQHREQLAAGVRVPVDIT
jgi:hypothetical protein